MRKGQYTEQQIIRVPRLTGAGSSRPFLYQGMEHEFTDPAPLYFDQGANVYNPMLQRELSQLGQQGIAGPPTAGAGDGGMGNGFGGTGPSQGFGNPGGLSGGRIASNLLTVAAPYINVDQYETGAIFLGDGGLLGDIFDLLDGGGHSAAPRQLRHARHPVYDGMVGIPSGLTPAQGSEQSYVIVIGKNTLALYGTSATYYSRLGTYPYTSGLYGDTDPANKGTGPLPPGNYTLNPSEITKAGFFRRYIDFRDWGNYRAPLHPDPGTNTFGRSGFFLHGGWKRPGSEGCIKVGGARQNELFRTLKKASGCVHVIN